MTLKRERKKNKTVPEKERNHMIPLQSKQRSNHPKKSFYMKQL